MARTVEPCFLAIVLPTLSPAAATRAAQWCMRWTPRVHVEAGEPTAATATTAAMDAAAAFPSAALPSTTLPPMVVLDLTGCQRANRGAARVLARVAGGLERRGIPFRLGLAPTAGAAIAFAMVGTSTSTSTSTSERPHLRALDALALEALRLPAPMLAALHEVNLRTIGELRAIARHAIADRYGPLPAQRLDALDAADGPRAWPFRAQAAPTPIEAEFPFAGPCTQLEAVERAFQHALGELCAQLDRRGRGARSLQVRIDFARAASVAGTLHFGVPTRDPRHLWSLLRPRVERVDLGDLERGIGVERVLLRVGRTARIAQGMGALVAGSGAEGDVHATTERTVGELVDMIVARIGEQGIRVPAEGPG